jgi:hypothetical protein
LVFSSGGIMLSPTIDLPPDSFGTEKIGFLDSDKLVFDPPTQTLQEGSILLSYFTKSGPDGPLDPSFNHNRIQVDSTPYA